MSMLTGAEARRSNRSTAAMLALAVAVGALPCTTFGCLDADVPEADLILVHGVVHPLTGSGEPASALAVRLGRILAVGDDASVLKHRGRKTIVVDLEGATVVPGFIDAHAHPLAMGEALLNEATGESLYLDLTEAESEEDIVQRARARARGLAPRQWVLGKGWNEERWIKKELPTKRLLSDIVRNNPAFLIRSDGHTAWVNRRALELAGIDRRTPDPAAGRILRHRRTGEPTGILFDGALRPVFRKIPSLGKDERIQAVLLALKRLASQGVTMVHVSGSSGRLGVLDLEAPEGEEIDLFRELAMAGRLPIRVSLMIPGPSPAAEALLRSGPEIGVGGGWLDVRTIELSADGALDNRGAALLQPYDDDPDSTGVLRMDREEIAAWAERGLRRGIQIAIHAEGDAAVRAAVGGFAKALDAVPGGDARFRVEHLSLFDPDDLPGLARIRATATVQPRRLLSGPEGPLAVARVGAERARRLYAFSTLLAAGVRLAASSDATVPVEHPLLAYYLMVTRRPPSGGAAGGWQPNERLGRREALRAFTLGAAHAASREKETGSLAPGKWADFTVLSIDPLTIPEEEILRTEVLATYVAGREVFHSERDPRH